MLNNSKSLLAWINGALKKLHYVQKKPVPLHFCQMLTDFSKILSLTDFEVNF